MRPTPTYFTRQSTHRLVLTISIDLLLILIVLTPLTTANANVSSALTPFLIGTARLNSPPALPQAGSLAVLKFHDVNGNGLYDGSANDPGIAGWVITYTDPAGNSSSQTTGAGGLISLTGLISGVYTLTEEARANWVQTTPLITPYTITVPDNGTGTAQFGNIQKSTLVCSLSALTPFSNYAPGSEITYTLQYTKSGLSNGVAPQVALAFTPTGVLSYVRSTSSPVPAAFAGGAGILANPYIWTAIDFQPFNRSRTLIATFQFMAAPLNQTLTATGNISTTYTANPAGSSCQTVKSFGPTALALQKITAQTDPGTVQPVLFVFSAFIAAVLTTVIILRKRSL